MRIRRMTMQDLEEVCQLEQQVFPDPWPKSSFVYEIRSNRFSIPLVLKEDNELIGYSIIWKIYEEFHIANIAIKPEHQGKGIGTTFLTKLLKLAGDTKYAILEVRENNKKAIHIYEKFGFKKIMTRKHYYKNGDTAWVMQKVL